MFQITTDEPSGIIRTSAQGLWSIASVDAFFVKLTERVTAMRLTGRPVRILSEVVEAAVQTPEIEARVLAHAERLYEAGDRRALVVKNSLRKVHVKTVAPDQQVAVFCSLAAAETWLCAHDYKLSA